ncbi:MAG: carboxypeptidase-like regulatory domain-containing protein [Bacteroidota bacterium]|nr:carboxypeptidase-like regulatory domain-containing protein [Bacteroidota bacterium]
MMIHKIAIAFILTIVSFNSSAREISGYVLDKGTNEPIPFSSAWIKGSSTGTPTDENGYFELSISDNDTLCVSSLGYQMVEIPAKQITEIPLNIYLINQVNELDEIIIIPGVSRAEVLFNKIQEHKKKNREQIYDIHNYNILETKTVYLAVDSISKIIRSFGNLNDVTVKMDNQTLRFSPVYLSEQAGIISNDSVYIVYEKNEGIFPRIKQTLESVVLNNVVADMDFYKDQINIMDRGFISPLNNLALLHYKIYLNDSTLTDSSKYYHFSFVPKNKTPCFPAILLLKT